MWVGWLVGTQSQKLQHGSGNGGGKGGRLCHGSNERVTTVGGWRLAEDVCTSLRFLFLLGAGQCSQWSQVRAEGCSRECELPGTSGPTLVQTKHASPANQALKSQIFAVTTCYLQCKCKVGAEGRVSTEGMGPTNSLSSVVHTTHPVPFSKELISDEPVHGVKFRSPDSSGSEPALASSGAGCRTILSASSSSCCCSSRLHPGLSISHPVSPSPASLYPQLQLPLQASDPHLDT